MVLLFSSKQDCVILYNVLFYSAKTVEKYIKNLLRSQNWHAYFLFDRKCTFLVQTPGAQIFLKSYKKESHVASVYIDSYMNGKNVHKISKFFSLFRQTHDNILFGLSTFIVKQKKDEIRLDSLKVSSYAS